MPVVKGSSPLIRGARKRRIPLIAGKNQIPSGRRNAILAHVLRLASGTIGRSPSGAILLAKDSKGRSMAVRFKR